MDPIQVFPNVVFLLIQVYFNIVGHYFGHALHIHAAILGPLVLLVRLPFVQLLPLLIVPGDPLQPGQCVYVSHHLLCRSLVSGVFSVSLRSLTSPRELSIPS